jgi:hypothetical protein
VTTYLVLLLITLPIPWIAKLIWPHEIKFKEVAVTVLASTFVLTSIYFLGRAGMTWDHEIWNGKITSKERKHGHYLQSYSCNCRSVCTGSGQNQTCSTTCDTCYEDRYTVTWTAFSTIGDFRIEHFDSGSKRVYQSPDPKRYSIIEKGDPCSTSNSFINYVKAVPESLFHANPLMVKQFQNFIPVYPGDVYDFYHVDRVLAVNVPVPELDVWNRELSKSLRELGPSKQANAIIVFVNTNDPNYQYALESAWIGGKKNDIILIMGVTSWPKIDWVAVSSWSKAEIFKVQLRDDIMALGEVKRDEILKLLEDHTWKSFKRRQMKEFEYLANEIEPPMWVIILALLFGIGISVGASFYFYHNDPFEDNQSRRRKW